MKPITVLIPTQRRPDSLLRALRSLLGQEDGAALVESVVVVDNAPEASARAVVETFAGQAPFPVHFVHEPRPGVATARNRGLAEVEARLVAFLDDDETASPAWLSELYQVHSRFGADVTFGAIQGRAPDASPATRAYLEGFFSREGPAESGLTEAVWGCGNSLMTRATALAGAEPFDIACNETGGEDDRLFQRVRASGGRFAWAADAWVDEHAPAHRATVAYALRRAFGYGQSPSQLAAQAGRPAAVAGWMLVGAAQAAVFGASALAMRLIAHPAAYALADRAARGVGKLIWFRAPKIYGAAGLRVNKPVAAPVLTPLSGAA